MNKPNLILESKKAVPIDTNEYIELNVGEKGLGAHIKTDYNLTGISIKFVAEGFDHNIITGGQVISRDELNGEFDFTWPEALTNVSSGFGHPFTGQFTLTSSDGSIVDVLSPFLIIVKPTIGIQEKYKGTIDTIDGMIKQSLEALQALLSTVQNGKNSAETKINDLDQYCKTEVQKLIKETNDKVEEAKVKIDGLKTRADQAIDQIKVDSDAKLQEVDQAAINQRNGFKTEFDTISKQIEDSLKDFKTSSENKIKDIDKKAEDQRTALNDDYENFKTGLEVSWNTKSGQLETDWTTKRAQLEADWTAKVTQLETEFNNTLTGLKIEWANKLSEIERKETELKTKADEISTGLNASNTTLNNLNTDINDAKTKLDSIKSGLSHVDFNSITQNASEAKTKAEAAKAEADSTSQALAPIQNKLSGIDDGTKVIDLINQTGKVKTVSLNGGTKLDPDISGNIDLSVPNPDLSGYAKKTDIPQAPDLSGYAKKTDLDLKADKTALDAKADKTALDIKADLSYVDAQLNKKLDKGSGGNSNIDGNARDPRLDDFTEGLSSGMYEGIYFPKIVDVAEGIRTADPCICGQLINFNLNAAPFKAKTGSTKALIFSNNFQIHLSLYKTIPANTKVLSFKLVNADTGESCKLPTDQIKLTRATQLINPALPNNNFFVEIAPVGVTEWNQTWMKYYIITLSELSNLKSDYFGSLAFYAVAGIQ